MLLTVVFAQFTSLFSMRLALRGGETSVEDTIMRVRGEYSKASAALRLSASKLISSGDGSNLCVLLPSAIAR
jgi:hypothetical protein